MRLVKIILITLVSGVMLAACGTSTAQGPGTQPSMAVAQATTTPTTAPIPTAASTATTASLPTTAATSASTAASTSVPATTTTPAATTVQPDATVAATTVPTKSATATGESPLVTQARIALLVQPGLGQQTLTVQSEKEVEWPTSALGCPEPGKSYLQVITPGVQIIFSDGARTYDIHTTRTGDVLIWCDDATPRMIGASK